MNAPVTVTARVAGFCSQSPERTAWLVELPRTVAELATRWHLAIGVRYDGEGEASWVARVQRDDGSPAVLKLGMPHWEGEHEARGLRFWDGDPTVRLLAWDDALGAMLLERCEPGAPLRALPEDQQDVVIASLLPRMWRTPPEGDGFRPLGDMIERWIQERLATPVAGADPALVRAGVDEFRALLASSPAPVTLATDLHAGNVLRAQRAPWLVIDPKPFVGDAAYDATQHLVNGPERMAADPRGTVARVADLLRLDTTRVRRWTFARIASRPRPEGTRHPWNQIARALAASA